MNDLIIAAKREYWENRSFVVGLPLVLVVISLLAAISVEIFVSEVTNNTVADIIENLSDETLSREDRKELEDELAKERRDFQMGSDSNAYEAMAWYVSIGWLAGFYYLLGALFNDRKDKSILFFKSLPISETFNVSSKLLFGCIGAALIAIVIGWLGSFSLMIFGLGDHQNQGLSFANLYAYTLAPLQAVIVGMIWGAPMFAYLAFASAAARKSPFLLAVVPLIVLSWVEGLFFKDIEILKFFFSHQPFAVLRFLEDSAGGSLWTEYFVNQGPSMILGLVLAAGFIAGAIWCRDHKFEI